MKVRKSVGTPGLGYSLLLCLGKSLVVILNYVQQPDPCGPEPCSPNGGPGPVLWLVPGAPRVPGKDRRTAQAAGSSGPPMEVRTPGNPGPPMGSRTPCIETGPLAKGRNRHPASGWSGATTCLRSQTRI